MEKVKEERAMEQAQAQIESIQEMIQRLKHCQECEGGEDCTLTDMEIYAGLSICYKEGDKATEEEREQYHDEESARDSIHEDPLSVEVVRTYDILLCTGGPACRIVGELDEHNQPDTARLQYQDWFIPWTELILTHSQYEDLLEYARQFYFEE